MTDRAPSTPNRGAQPADDGASRIRVAFPARGSGGEVASVALVTLDRERALNALDFALIAQLTDALEALDADPDCHCIVITGAGTRAFAAGADIHELAGQTLTEEELASEGEEMIGEMTVAFAWLVSFGTCFGMVVSLWLYRKLRPTTITLIQVIVPAEAILIGTFWLGEPVSIRMLAGAALVVAAVGLNAIAGGGTPPAEERLVATPTAAD